MAGTPIGSLRFGVSDGVAGLAVVGGLADLSTADVRRRGSAGDDPRVDRLGLCTGAPLVNAPESEYNTL